MAVFMVEERAGVSVRASTLVANVGLFHLVSAVSQSAPGFGHSARVQALLLHQG